MTTAEQINDRPQMTDLCKERDVGIVCVFVERTKDENGWEHFQWSVTLMYQKRSYKTTFRCGVGHVEPNDYGRRRVLGGTPKPPTAADVLSSLCSDARSADRVTFEDWCSEFGYDTDSRRAEKTYLACVEINAKLHALLGEDFDLFANAEH